MYDCVVLKFDLLLNWGKRVHGEQWVYCLSQPLFMQLCSGAEIHFRCGQSKQVFGVCAAYASLYLVPHYVVCSSGTAYAYVSARICICPPLCRDCCSLLSMLFWKWRLNVSLRASDVNFQWVLYTVCKCRLNLASSCIIGYNQGGHSYRPWSPEGQRPESDRNWPPRWYAVTQEEVGFNLFVAIPLNIVTFRIHLACAIDKNISIFCDNLTKLSR